VLLFAEGRSYEEILKVTDDCGVEAVESRICATKSLLRRRLRAYLNRITQEQIRGRPTSDNVSDKPTSSPAHLFRKECIINRVYPFMHSSCNICRVNVQGFSKTMRVRVSTGLRVRRSRRVLADILKRKAALKNSMPLRREPAFIFPYVEFAKLRRKLYYQTLCLLPDS
jgi:hypothetical protein